MISASAMRKKVTMGVEIGGRRSERKEFNNTFRENKFVVERLREEK